MNSAEEKRKSQKKISFASDYIEGAHPGILEKIFETNLEQLPGYGKDIYCEQAADLIKEKCGKADVDVHFMTGGTQTNLTLISAALRPHEAVISADSGHIEVYETGAIEAQGHKILTLPAKDGKISLDSVKELVKAHEEDFAREHMAKPAMVYISNTSELGTFYNKRELAELSEFCREKDMYLFVDGARLAYALAAEGNDVSLQDMAEMCDAFYIGGTKVGALFGEALLISNDRLKKDFRYIMKQKGGLLAKGRYLGLQFFTLMENNLYLEIARYANQAAALVDRAFAEEGFEFFAPTQTNQVFPILPLSAVEELKKKYVFEIWEPYKPGFLVVRFCTSWATKKEAMDLLVADIGLLGKGSGFQDGVNKVL